MPGYLGEPERRGRSFRDGWYVTGDIARIDEDGFIRITDRLSRFSKIGGEMVPHMKIEEAMQALLGDPSHRRGHRGAGRSEGRAARRVLHRSRSSPPQEIWERLSETDLPRLWMPKREDIRFVESIPTLGTGKVDLRAVRALAIGAMSLTSSARGSRDT